MNPKLYPQGNFTFHDWGIGPLELEGKCRQDGKLGEPCDVIFSKGPILPEGLCYKYWDQDPNISQLPNYSVCGAPFYLIHGLLGFYAKLH